MGPRRQLLSGAKKVEVLFKGLSEMYLFAITYFCSSYITGEEIIDLKLFHLCYFVVLLREVTIHIESLVEPCFSKNQN